MRRILLALACAVAAWGALADATETAVAPNVRLGTLPPLGANWLAANPYRGRSDAPAIGRDAYNQACARCHGADAATNAAPAPDLRNLDRGCRRIGDMGLKARCMADNDTYFAKSVRSGKVILGVTHMPPWEGILPQELAWAIQTFIESRSAAPPAKRTTVPEPQSGPGVASPGPRSAGDGRPPDDG